MKIGTLPQSEDLKCFAVIVQEGSLSGASRALNLPKSTISRRLSRLEKDIGLRLFHRNRQRLELTNQGHQILRLCEVTLEGLNDIALVGERQTNPQGRLRISAPMDISVYTSVWIGFAQSYPEVELEVDFTNRYVDVIREGFDLVLRAGLGEDESLVARRIGSYDLIAVSSPRYLKDFGVVSERSELFNHSCLLLRNFRSASGAQTKPHRHLVFNDVSLVLSGALQGMGIAILPRILVEEHMQAGRLVTIFEEYNPLQIPLYAMFPERQFLRPAVIVCLEYMQQAFAD